MLSPPRFLTLPLALALALALACSADPVDTGRRDAGGADGGDALDAGSPDATARDAATDAGPPSPDAGAPDCDPGFLLTPAAPETGRVNTIAFRDDVAFVHIGLDLPGASVGGADISSMDGTYRWAFPVTFPSPGRYTARFTADMGATLVGACAFDVADTGPPPDLPGPSCATRVCGESDGAGGTCTRCPMVESEGGACMDPPSPVGPDGPGASWACLDSAGCLEGSGLCRIWCPGEPCDMERHPDGCPQGVESCLVPAWVTDYEEACRMCCTSRRHDPTGEFACWDDAYNLCRYPGDCGMPYPLP
ncbi:MAG TPA: hypothetical protein RMH85_07805 [Polyangiaceae bacterium LLY-WYZ-15_(1-7)]|nr:hypothetical protein [Polyangiaceae bacterium LLY-WYZ-15_(1-7)]HJL08386.1 hypothetical protein [Polyangiaceae bacterium LLY-WYZ-15_(1-7)]